jgi:hypothetical protein
MIERVAHLKASTIPERDRHLVHGHLIDKHIIIMLTEEHYNPIPPEERDQGSREVRVSIEPEKLPSLSELAKEGRSEFLTILREADIRSLVRYIERSGLKADEIPQLAPLWKAYFRTKEFRRKPYTWRNPKLHFVTPQSVATIAVRELLARLSDKVPPHNLPISSGPRPQ